ncbi:MAG: hypothetical protein QOJ30_6233 [Pseudonocardiales bacterium]|jgi:hypothetical protein|nr:hypothetical protein [Pseudonocardiales bacterium]
MTNEQWLFLILGLLGGLYCGTYLGRWWAEFRRASFDMDRIWNSRKNYRDG